MLSTFGIAAAIGVAFGLTPMWLLARGRVNAGIRPRERGFSASKWSARLGNSIVAGEVALCLVLLAAAGLLTRSFVRMSTMSTGLRTDHILMTPLDLMPDRYENWRKRVNFYEEVLRRVETIPGVRGAGIASRVDLVGAGLGYMLQVEGSADLGSRNPSARGRSVSPGYFNVVGIPLLRGRMFTERDTSTSARVAMINEAFAKKFFPGTDPIGKHITYSTDRIHCEVVGVAANVRSGMQDATAEEELYLPLSQRPWLVAKLLVRTGNPAGMMSAIRNRIQAVDPSQAVADSVLLEQVVSDRLGRPRTAMLVVVLFAGSALLLAAVGIYGVIAYSVAQRRKEIGIRMALGADTYRIQAMVFRQTFRLLVIGLILGLPLAMMLSRLYTSLLFEVKPGDPITFACVIGILFSVALASSYLPAIRAAKVDPVVVLRID
jgi:putative ABC transport system permease protein